MVRKQRKRQSEKKQEHLQEYRHGDRQKDQVDDEDVYTTSAKLKKGWQKIKKKRKPAYWNRIHNVSQQHIINKF